jgi:hypothetical protein
MYLNKALVELSFERLSSTKDTGKASLEKTSALMYFLAFDTVVKKTGKCPFDLHPKRLEGQNNRADMKLAFLRLVFLGLTNKKVMQVVTLGKIDTGGRSPEKRITANFLTVPLKKASVSNKPYLYPSRPAPVLQMGNIATGLEWGIGYFDDWKRNLPRLLSEVKSNTQFTDLAVFVLRNIEFRGNDFRGELMQSIESMFTSDFSEFWKRQIESEKVFFKHGVSPFQTTPPITIAGPSAADEIPKSVPEILKRNDTLTLLKRIEYLEGLLDSLGIGYQPISLI